jgi:hypothetical protein
MCSGIAALANAGTWIIVLLLLAISTTAIVRLTLKRHANMIGWGSLHVSTHRGSSAPAIRVSTSRQPLELSDSLTLYQIFDCLLLLLFTSRDTTLTADIPSATQVLSIPRDSSNYSDGSA